MATTATTAASSNLTSHFWESDTESEDEDLRIPERSLARESFGLGLDLGIPSFDLEPARELDLQLYLPSSVFVPGDRNASRRGSGVSTPRPAEVETTAEDVESEPQSRGEIESKAEIEGHTNTEAEESIEEVADMGRIERADHRPDREDDTMKEVNIQIPVHPIPSMQAAFAESMLEANDTTTTPIPKSPVGNASVRRKILLDQEIGEETHAARWKQRPGQKYHELWKLMAQISFGVYLLMKGIAKDDDQVMNILQGHVDEVDEFLENTLEDFDLAQEDIEERLKFLKLPLENIIIFDAMLEDRAFRLQIISGNERIEHVITRTATAMNDALKDVQQGLDACKEFTIYLAEEEKNAIWMKERPDMQKVFDAMKGNVEGWYKAYVSLQTKGHHLGIALVQLGSIVAEMDRRAAEISRKSRFSTPTVQMASLPASPPQSNEMRQSMLKSLPSDPNIITPAIRATLPAFQMVPDREHTPDHTSEASSEAEPEPEPEPDFILKPTIYTPVPSPKPPSAPVQESPPPEVSKRSSLRKRFSLKKEVKAESVDDYWGPKHRVVPSAAKERAREIVIEPREQTRENERIRENTLNERREQIRGSTINDRERIRESKVNERPRESSLNTPPSRGLDSAYCSDFEKNSPAAAAPNIPLHQTHSHTSLTSRPFNHAPIPSPLSDRQFWRPVQASPNSPLQRPWTAGPSNPLHTHSNSSTSNLSARNNYHAHTPSQLGLHRGAPSAMGMSVMSDTTMVTDIETGKKVKKKRSAFGWLKKAFSLDEEEKKAFEERKTEAQIEREQYYRAKGESRKWIDGKRVRQ